MKNLEISMKKSQKVAAGTKDELTKYVNKRNGLIALIEALKKDLNVQKEQLVVCLSCVQRLENEVEVYLLKVSKNFDLFLYLFCFITYFFIFIFNYLFSLFIFNYSFFVIYYYGLLSYSPLSVFFYFSLYFMDNCSRLDIIIRKY